MYRRRTQGIRRRTIRPRASGSDYDITMPSTRTSARPARRPVPTTTTCSPTDNLVEEAKARLHHNRVMIHLKSLQLQEHEQHTHAHGEDAWFEHHEECTRCARLQECGRERHLRNAFGYSYEDAAAAPTIRIPTRVNAVHDAQRALGPPRVGGVSAAEKSRMIRMHRRVHRLRARNTIEHTPVVTTKMTK